MIAIGLFKFSEHWSSQCGSAIESLNNRRTVAEQGLLWSGRKQRLSELLANRALSLSLSLSLSLLLPYYSIATQ